MLSFKPRCGRTCRCWVEVLLVFGAILGEEFLHLGAAKLVQVELGVQHARQKIVICLSVVVRRGDALLKIVVD